MRTLSGGRSPAHLSSDPIGQSARWHTICVRRANHWPPSTRHRGHGQLFFESWLSGETLSLWWNMIRRSSSRRITSSRWGLNLASKVDRLSARSALIKPSSNIPSRSPHNICGGNERFLFQPNAESENGTKLQFTGVCEQNLKNLTVRTFHSAH